jgi:hypothetical protein
LIVVVQNDGVESALCQPVDRIPSLTPVFHFYVQTPKNGRQYSNRVSVLAEQACLKLHNEKW